MNRRESHNKSNQDVLASLALIKLLAVILIAGFIIICSAAALSIIRVRARDAARVEDIAAVRGALATYLGGSLTGYPASTGECLTADRGVGKELLESRVLLILPLDPLWAEAATVINQKSFCYYYFSDAANRYEIKFFLEADSKAGRAGINTVTQ